jgi:hypothetical protein
MLAPYRLSVFHHAAVINSSIRHDAHFQSAYGLFMQEHASDSCGCSGYLKDTKSHKL